MRSLRVLLASLAVAGCAAGGGSRLPAVQRLAVADSVAIPDRWLLVYAGSASPVRFDSATFARMLGRDTAAVHCPQPLFDGAIFLSMQLAADRPLFTSWLPAARTLGAADGEEWGAWLDTVFAPGGAAQRLDRALAADPPAAPLRLAVMLPYLGAASAPLAWRGRRYEGRDTADVRAFYRAYLADVKRRASDGRYSHAVLAAVYWLNEGLLNGDSLRIPIVAEEAHAAGLRLLWIPAYRARGAAAWRALGFDQAWYQPNRFFHADVPDTRVDSAVAFARAHGMGVEIEFDRGLLRDEALLPRLDAYLRRIDGRSARSVAVYDGAGALPLLLGDRRVPYRQAAERLARALCRA